jgi:hypothetical protein
MGKSANLLNPRPSKEEIINIGKEVKRLKRLHSITDAMRKN